LKPGITAPDGGDTSFFFARFTNPATVGGGEPDQFPNFFGTSASAPHAAAARTRRSFCPTCMETQVLGRLYIYRQGTARPWPRNSTVVPVSNPLVLSGPRRFQC
jgi:hypothetical protein